MRLFATPELLRCGRERTTGARPDIHKNCICVRAYGSTGIRNQVLDWSWLPVQRGQAITSLPAVPTKI